MSEFGSTVCTLAIADTDILSIAGRRYANSYPDVRGSMAVDVAVERGGAEYDDAAISAFGVPASTAPEDSGNGTVVTASSAPATVGPPHW
ncbi:hypothetical protein [Rhodococcus olei]|uniref:hypothetical protein n=1 Tax=Rhodococcus olei TaxID=2161675 RepID=UPI0031EA47AC